LERINPARGYTPRNTQIVCWHFNAAKHEYGLAQLLALSLALVTKHGLVKPSKGKRMFGLSLTKTVDGWRYQEEVEAVRARNAAERLRRVQLSFLSAPGTLNQFAAACHADAAQWWVDPLTGKYGLYRNHGECFALIHSEISEAMEGVRKDKMDEHLPHRKSVEVELADALIRIFDYAGAYGLDLDGAVAEKRAFNKVRADHTPEVRAAEGGKKW
jgi:NTP pyrophosphatase (non-canonical NTP hydrolase)